MKKVTAKLIASVLIISFLILPADLSAKERRGADLIVTRLDGSQVAGELIAGKPETVVNEYWNKLRAHAREPRLPGRSSSSR
jgi:hypothetical protein